MLNAHKILVLLVTVGLGLAVAQNAEAEVPSEATDSCATSTPDSPAAYELFNQGAELYKAGNYEAASQKFIESYCLWPSAKTLQVLARCREKQSKFASAYSDYLRAAELAADTQRTQVATDARQGAQRIEARRSHLTIRVESSVPNLVILRNGTNVGAIQYGQRLPVDPGDYLVTAQAPGYAAFEQRVSIGANADDQTLVVPPLQPLPPAHPIAAAPPPAPVSPAQHVTVSTSAPLVTSTTVAPENPWPWVLGGVGVAAVVLGGVSGTLALRDKHQVDSACHEQSVCSDSAALSIQSRRDFEWTMARVTLPIGLAAIAAAVTWLTLESKEHKQTERAGTLQTFDTSFDERGGTLWARGRF